MGYKKGYIAERDLKLKLEREGWTVIRSGGSKKPDLIAGKKGRILVIECKVTGKNAVYVSSEEVKNLKGAAKAFGGTPALAVKTKNSGWNLLKLKDLKRAGKFFCWVEK